MAGSILSGKRILAVDDEPDVLAVLGEEILHACTNCQVDKAGSYETAVEMLKSRTYAVVVLDIMGVRGFELLDVAVSRNFPVAMLTAHALSPEALKRAIEMGARTYLPKEKIGEIVSFLEDILKYDYEPGWRHLMENLRGFFNTRWGDGWWIPEAKFWSDFDKKTEKSTGRRSLISSRG